MTTTSPPPPLLSLPVVDLGPHLAGEPGGLESAGAAVRAALVELGFFSIVGHGVAWDQVQGIYRQAARYHDLPDEVKERGAIGARVMGYMPLGGSQRGDRPPAHNTAFFMARPGSQRNQFPPAGDLPDFEDTVTAYYRAMDSLCHCLLPLYAVAAGMPGGHFDRYFDPALATLRLTRYPPLPSGEDRFGIDPHTDAGFMTLLPTNPVPGLQIRPPGGDWLAVEQEPESFVVNSGDTLRRWSNDVFLSTEHRVLNTSGADRFGIPFFFDPRVDTVVEPLPGCVDETNPPRHEPMVYRDYLTEFMGRGYRAVRT